MTKTTIEQSISTGSEVFVIVLDSASGAVRAQDSAVFSIKTAVGC